MKLSPQEVFEKACNSLRTYGNPYGSKHQRGWSWINSQNPKERCAIASFCEGNNYYELQLSLLKMFGITDSHDYVTNEAMLDNAFYNEYSVCNAIMNMFDMEPYRCNNKDLLEESLERIADLYGLEYKTDIENIKTEQKVTETV